MKFEVELSDETIAEIANYVIGIRDRLNLDWIDNGSPWMSRKQAAEYLDVPLSRLEKDRTVPCHRWDGRVMYDRRELDEWLRSK